MCTWRQMYSTGAGLCRETSVGGGEFIARDNDEWLIGREAVRRQRCAKYSLGRAFGSGDAARAGSAGCDLCVGRALGVSSVIAYSKEQAGRPLQVELSQDI
jgi:hypothetical protein